MARIAPCRRSISFRVLRTSRRGGARIPDAALVDLDLPGEPAHARQGSHVRLCLANTASGKIRLTSAPSLAILRAMRHLVRAVTAIGFALSTRRDLLLEILALRHQLRGLVRSNRHFRPSDRLLWLVLRRSWPRWRDALALVQPATVDRWHRDGLHRCWRRRSRRPGRPRIDSECRALIQRVAQENRLWGAPRIHGELRKLGIVVSERTCCGSYEACRGDRHRLGGHSS